MISASQACVDRLTALGVTPGAAIVVLQTFPAFVFSCDQTEVAVEPDVAHAVLIDVMKEGCMKRVGFLSVLIALAIGCSSIKPIPVVAGDVCSRCRRSIVDPALAGELINASLYATKYRTPACMAQYLNEHPQDTMRAVYVTDYASGRMIPAAGAYFVKTEVDAVTHEIDFAAFRSKDEAVAFGTPTGSKPIDWTGVRQFAAERTSN